MRTVRIFSKTRSLEAVVKDSDMSVCFRSLLTEQKFARSGASRKILMSYRYVLFHAIHGLRKNLEPTFAYPEGGG
jgi:hypothetical protein